MSTANATTPAEIKRRRGILQHYIGTEMHIKRAYLRPADALRGVPGLLLKVHRTRCEMDFGSLGVWVIPVNQVLMPWSTEPDPKQTELFK